MGDGNITWDANNEKLALEDVQPTEKQEEYYDTPRSSIEGNSSTPRAGSTTSPDPTTIPFEVEELHRNTNNSVNTPDLSSASIGIPTVDRPPAGEAQISPRRNGRRNFRGEASSADNAFGLPLGPAAGLGRQETNNAADGIFSVRGTRSVKINRHRDNVTVFPTGCMGVTDIEEESLTPTEEAVVPAPIPEAVVPAPIPEADVAASVVAPTHSRNAVGGRPNSGVRNPLTGEGYEEKDIRRHFAAKKPDGNPVSGHGYEDAKNVRNKHVPPGGYSKGLW